MRILKKTLYNILYILSVLDFILAVTIFIPIKGVIGDFLRPLRSLFTTTLYYNCIVLIIVSVGTIIYVKINYIKVKDARAFFILHLIHFATLALGIVISCSVTYCNDFMQGITYECCYPGADKGDHSLISVDDCSEKYNVNQCDVFLDYKSPYRTTAVVYLNYKDPWEADDTPELFNTTHKDIIPGNNKNGGKSIKTFCNNEGYSYVSLNIEFSDSDNLVSFETKIRNCITSIKKDFGF